MVKKIDSYHTAKIDQLTMSSVDKMKTHINATSRIEVIRRAIKLLETYIEITQNGGKLIIEDMEGNSRQIMML